MRVNLPRLFMAPCEHAHVMVVRSAGLERIVCENCGHVSFSFDSEELDLVTADSATAAD